MTNTMGRNFFILGYNLFFLGLNSKYYKYMVVFSMAFTIWVVGMIVKYGIPFCVRF